MHLSQPYNASSVDVGCRVGQRDIHAAMKLCTSSPLNTTDAVLQLREWIGSAWDYMAMGNFPYPSSYMLNGNGELPAFPVRVACNELAEPKLNGTRLLEGNPAIYSPIVHNARW